MRRKKQIFYIALICLLMLMVLAGFSLLLDQEPVPDPAEQYSDLQIQLEVGEKIERISIWQDTEAEMYYFFLPSAAKLESIRFCNISKEDSLILDGQEVYSDIVLEHFYEMQLVLQGVYLEPVKMQFIQSGNLAAMFIETESHTTDQIHNSKEAEEAATVVLVDEQGKVDYYSEIEYIRTRGNSTFANFDKKAYQLKCNKRASLLGMAKAKKWILLANAIDDSFVRNALVYQFAQEHTTIPSIEGKFLDLYINGSYCGNYYLCEKAEVDKNRLDITDLDAANEKVNTKEVVESAETVEIENGKYRACPELENPDDITGGYLVESITEEEYASVLSGFRTNGGYYFKITSPQKATLEQVKYICGLFDAFEAAIETEDGINPESGKHYTEYIDLESWIEKYLIDEVFHDPDAQVASLFFYKDADSADTHIFAGPVWDYDRAIGSYGENNYELDDPTKIGIYGIYVPQILKKDVNAKELLKEKLQKIFIPYIENELNQDVTEYQVLLEASCFCDKKRWPQNYGYYSDLDSSMEYIKYFMHQKKRVLENTWLQEEQYHSITFLDYDGNAIKTYRVKHGEYLKEEIIMPRCYVALFSGWKNVATGKSYDTRIPILEDAVYQSEWLELSVLMENGLNVSDIDLSKIDIEALEDFIRFIKDQQKELVK